MRRIHTHRGEVPGQTLHELDVRRQPLPEERGVPGDQRVERDRTHVGRRLGGEREQGPREGRGSPRLVTDFGDVLGPRGTLGKINRQQFGRGEDGGEDVVEVVGHPSGEATYRLHLGRDATAFLERSRGGDGPRHGHEPGLTIRRRTHRDPGDLPARRPMAQGQPRVRRIGRGRIRSGGPHELAHRHPSHPSSRGIRQQATPFLVGHDDGIREGVQHRLEHSRCFALGGSTADHTSPISAGCF